MSEKPGHPSIRSVTVTRPDGVYPDVVVVEEPLEIRVNGESLAVVLRTPGIDSSEDIDLTLGFLVTEGVIDGLDDVEAISPCTDPNVPNRNNVIVASLASGTYSQFDRIRKARRSFFIGSSCGVCGKTSIDNVFMHADPVDCPVTLSKEYVSSLPLLLRKNQPRFQKTGGLHGAIAVSLDGEFITGAEDIGRHNAVDKVVGNALRTGRFPFHRHVLFVSSRAGFEIVQKALMARFCAVVSVGAASSLADELARRSGLALYSFARDGRYNHHQG